MDEGTSPLAFEPLSERPGIAVIDRIEHQRFELHTAEPVSPLPVGTDDFHFPVERAVEFSTREVALPTAVLVFVRNQDGDVIAEVDHEDTVSLPRGDYALEFATQIKTYVGVDDVSVEITRNVDGVRVSFDVPATLRLGTRSRHERPAATVTTTAKPIDVMAAIETFGSALKTHDPERSYPTLRGHPPAVQLGDELEIPRSVEPPETGVTLELPLQYDALYVAAPLAYYLGARLEPGPSPRLVTDDGFEHSFATPQGYEAKMVDTLKQVFFFDCLTRTEGIYQIPLHEREMVEPLVDFDFASLYHRPLTEQVAAYLDVPFEIVEEHLPEWRLTTHVEPVADTVEQLPFVLDDLAVVRTSSPASAATSGPGPAAIADLSGEEVFTRSASETSSEDAAYVQPDATDALEQAWIGDEIPVGASKLTPEAFRNRLDRKPTDGDISIAIVVNDPRMNKELGIVDSVYGDQDELPFDVAVHHDTTIDELRALLARQTGFLHYIGHTENGGFECSDGSLDTRSLEETGVEAFLLNACNSYRQGLGLIEAGAIGGIVTLQDIINEQGVKMGETIARLLNTGFPLRAALTIARNESIQGGQYIVVGDGGVTVSQAPVRTPTVFDVAGVGEEYELAITTYATDDAGLGSTFKPFIEGSEAYYLSSGEIDSFTLAVDELLAFLWMADFPVRIGDRLHWSSKLEESDLSRI